MVCAVADVGVTVMLCSCRVAIMLFIIPLLQAIIAPNRPATRRQSREVDTGRRDFCRRFIDPPFGRQSGLVLRNSGAHTSLCISISYPRKPRDASLANK